MTSVLLYTLRAPLLSYLLEIAEFISAEEKKIEILACNPTKHQWFDAAKFV